MLKYKSSDAQKLIDLFSSIYEKNNDFSLIKDELIELCNYPVNVIEVFLSSIEFLKDKDEKYLKDNYQGIIGIITLRMNLV